MFEDNEIDIEHSFIDKEPLLRVGAWMDEDKDYSIGTREKYEEFVKNRNYPICWCHTCRPITIDDMRMVLCPECGNKRCPKATDHRLECTNSNEPNQVGSIY